MKLHYLVRYSDRKTFGISVERDASIIVRVPYGTSSDKIKDFVESKRFWIYTKQNHPQKYSRRQRKEFVSGAEIMFLGRSYRLEVVNTDKDELFFNNRFLISKKRQEQAPGIFKRWYIEKASDKISKRVRFYANNLGVDYGDLNITELKYRWGSCTPKNNLNFNWKLIKAPIPVVDYVIVHELAHLLESNHTSKFWNVVKTQLPKFPEAKTWLKDNGSLLESDF